MKHPFTKESTLYPFRWFIVIISVLTLTMSYLDLGGYRMLTFASRTTPTGYPAASGGHK